MKICAVVVTYNRLEELKKCIASLKSQTRKPDSILVINNSSTDGTFEWLKVQEGLDIITQPNLGGAGGFHTGIKIAYKKGFDWLWCLDGDVIPNYDSLEKLLSTKNINDIDVGFLSSQIYFNRIELAFPNLPELDAPDLVLNALFVQKPIPIIAASFGSLLIPQVTIKNVGLPCKEFYIWGDDSEYTLRIVQMGFRGFLVHDSLARHVLDENIDDPFVRLPISNFKFKYGVRNQVYISILRNKIVHKSVLRGVISATAFIFRIIRRRLRLRKENPIQMMIVLIYLYAQGLYMKTRIEYVD